MTFHFAITIVTPDGYASFEGVVTPHPGATRQDLYRDACAYARSETGCDGAVVYFSLEPNDLGVSR